MARAAAPYWPRLMKLGTAAAYCDMTLPEFEREVAAGRLPGPWRFGRWSRPQLDDALGDGEGAAPDWRSQQPLYQA